MSVSHLASSHAATNVFIAFPAGCDPGFPLSNRLEKRDHTPTVTTGGFAAVGVRKTYVLACTQDQPTFVLLLQLLYCCITSLPVLLLFCCLAEMAGCLVFGPPYVMMQQRKSRSEKSCVGPWGEHICSSPPPSSPPPHITLIILVGLLIVPPYCDFVCSPL